MYCIAWKYDVEKSKSKAFEEHYARGGVWFRFFEPCDDYLGHDLMQNIEDGSYLIIDKWMGKSEYDSFLKINQAEYEALNAQTADLYDQETHIGSYETL